MSKPRCEHSSLKSDCHDCEVFKQRWYQKLSAADPDWRDIEYGRERPDRLYEPVRTDAIDELTTDYYDRVLELHHDWLIEGRSKRECLIAELLGLQVGDTGTERGIAAVLKSKRLTPNSRGAVRRVIQEIKSIVLKKAQGDLNVEQGQVALYPLDSKPNKDEADGQKAPTKPNSRAA